MTSSPSHQLAAPFARTILAVDDLLGKVYASCSSPSDKRAFRQATATCYRSPSINAQLSHKSLWHCQTGDVVATLAAFPRYAQLSSLTISAPDPSYSELFKHLLQSDNAVSSKARRTLSSVARLSLTGFSRLGSFDATALALLFPRLRDPGSDSYLDLDFYAEEDLKDPFTAIVAGQVKPTTLSLFCHSRTSLQPLASMQQLQRLILDVVIGEQLHSLSEVLGHLPLLHTLSVNCCEEHSLGGTRIAAPALRKIDLGLVSPSCPQLRASDLPALQQVCLSGIILKAFPEDTDPAVALSKVHSFASWLSKLPLKLSAAVDEDAFTFTTSPGFHALNPSFQTIFCTALSPLKPFLATVTKLCITDYGLICEQSVLSGLTDVFCNLVSLDLADGTLMEAPAEVKQLLQDLPRLEFLAIRVYNAPPKDLCAALKWAADEGRTFRLEVIVADSGENDWYGRMTFLADQVCSAYFRLLGPSVELIVLEG